MNRETLLPLLKRWSELAPDEWKHSGAVLGVGPLCAFWLADEEYIEFPVADEITLVQQLWIELSIKRCVENRVWCWNIFGSPVCGLSYSANIIEGGGQEGCFDSEDKPTALEAILTAYIEALAIHG